MRYFVQIYNCDLRDETTCADSLRQLVNQASLLFRTAKGYSKLTQFRVAIRSICEETKFSLSNFKDLFFPEKELFSIKIDSKSTIGTKRQFTEKVMDFIALVERMLGFNDSITNENIDLYLQHVNELRKTLAKLKTIFLSFPEVSSNAKPKLFNRYGTLAGRVLESFKKINLCYCYLCHYSGVFDRMYIGLLHDFSDSVDHEILLREGRDSFECAVNTYNKFPSDSSYQLGKSDALSEHSFLLMTYESLYPGKLNLIDSILIYLYESISILFSSKEKLSVYLETAIKNRIFLLDFLYLNILNTQNVLQIKKFYDDVSQIIHGEENTTFDPILGYVHNAKKLLEAKEKKLAEEGAKKEQESVSIKTAKSSISKQVERKIPKVEEEKKETGISNEEAKDGEHIEQKQAHGSGSKKPIDPINFWEGRPSFADILEKSFESDQQGQRSKSTKSNCSLKK